MSETPETDAQLTTFTSISKLKKHFTNRTGTVSAEFARKLERQRDRYARALEFIAEDSEAWLANQCDETCCEMIKLIEKYAREHLSDKFAHEDLTTPAQ